MSQKIPLYNFLKEKIRGFKGPIAFKIAVTVSLGLFVVLSILFHISFNIVENNLLVVIKDKAGHELSYYAEDIKKALSNNRVIFIISTISSIFISIFLVMFIFSRLIKKPFEKLIVAIEQIEKGNYEVSVDVKGSDEFAVLSQKFNNMTRAVRDFQKKIAEEFVNEKIAIVDSMPVGVVIISHDKKVLFANLAALKMLNAKLGELVGNSFPFSVTPGLIKEFELKHGIVVRAIVEMRSLMIEWQKSPAYLIIMIDVTRLKSIEKELREAKEKAESATVAKSLFLANMSHEIRTPMNAVIGMADLLYHTDLTPEQRSYLNTIKAASENLLRIINDILDLSKIESGKLELDNTAFNLEGVINETMSLFYNQAVSKGLALAKHIDEDVPTSLKGDPLRLRQVLFNLISNAIKFTEKGEITVNVKKLKTIDAGAEAADKEKVMLLFSVKDTGIGIPYALQERIFDSFTQADSSITKKYGGTGLGLAICKEIVRLMKGKIWVESEPNKGSEFIFTALFETVKSHDSGRSIPVAVEDHQKDYCQEKSGIKILVAEDDKLNQQIISLILKKNGIDFVIVENGKQVIEMLQKEHFDMILMDVQMPDMDGLEATKIIRKSSSGLFDPQIPIVAVTAFALKEDAQRCYESGMDEYISKPIKAERLLEVIRKIATKKRVS